MLIRLWPLTEKAKCKITHFNKRGEILDLTKPLSYETSKQIGAILNLDRVNSLT